MSTPAVEADLLRRRFGVNVHATWRTGPYAATTAGREAVASLVAGLGVGWLRDKVSTTDTGQPAVFRNLAELSGAQFLGIVGNPGDAPATAAAAVTFIRDTYGSELFGALEGLNEADSGTGWAKAVTAYQKQLFQSAKAVWPGRPVVGPSVAGVWPDVGADFDALKAAGVAQWCDGGNLHHYPRIDPESTLSEKLTSAQAAYGHPTWVTEFGWADVNVSGTSTDDIGVFAPRMLAEGVRRNLPMLCGYELLDQSNRTDGYTGKFGIVNSPTNDPSTWTVKPAYTTLQRLVALTADAAHTPRPLPGSVTIDGRRLILSRSDGGWTVLLWREVDPAGATTQATVTLDAPMTAEVVDVVTGATTTKVAATSHKITTGASLLAVTIR